MKKIIILLLVTSTISIYSQDYEPTNWNFVWGHSSTPRPFLLDSFQQETVQNGFQWGGSTQMNNALFNTVRTGATLSNLSGTPIIPLNLIFQPVWEASSGYNPGYFGAVMMQYDPTLPISDLNEGEILRPDDPSDPVFGFKNREGTILTNPLDENYSRLLLYKDSSYVGDTVLSNLWPQPEFYTRDQSGGQTDSYYGEKWYLTINLKRLNPIADSLKDNSPVLSLKIPYTNWDNQNGKIKFRTLPSNTPNDTTNLDYFEDRGVQQNINNATTTDSLLITNNMLPNNDDNYDNITISAEFITDDDTKIFSNYKFSRKDEVDEHIRDIDIEVVYHGNTDVAIDYIRIENVVAHHMLRGEADSLGSWYHQDTIHLPQRLFIKHTASDDEKLMQSIKDVVQSSIDALKVKTNDWEDAKIFRLKFQDTENSSYYWWGALRYVNKFSNGMYLTRDGLKDTKLYDYYTKAPNRWVEYTYDQDYSLMPAPYATRGFQDWTTMGLKAGYKKSGDHEGGIVYHDSLSSDFEVKLREEMSWDDLKMDSNYSKQVEHSDVLQARYEKTLKYGIHNQEDRTNGFLYTGKPWYQYMLLYQFSYPGDSLSAEGYHKFRSPYRRPLTFEEYYLLNFGCIINGAKGIINDGDQNRDLPVISSGNMGVGDHTKLNDTTDIYSNLVGDDFVNDTFDTWDAYAYLDIDTLSERMEVAPDRIYIGTKSYRDVLYQMSTFFRAVDSELMDLRLAATYSKGYRELYSQDEDMFGTDTLLCKFVNLGDSSEIYSSRIKKSLFDTMLDEPFDSTFINMTLLRGDSTNLDSVFYIGIQNRRTDPLIYWTNPNNPSQKYLRFLSSAEFRDSCINSPDSLLYQDYWWKRQGARKITIPFNYTYSDTNTYNLLRISELGSDVDSLNQLWHRGEKYYDLVIDTVIGQNRSLSFNLLPGQGKILKVEVLKSDTVAGFLNNYNQTKLISFDDPTIPNTIKYHMVYHRNSPNPNDTSITYQEVKYIESIPITKNSEQENIYWNKATQIDLSDDFLANLPIDPNKVEYPNCNNPSIVVRDSAGTPMAYVVYTCADSNRVAGDSTRIVYAKINTMSNSIRFNNQIYHSKTDDIYRYGTPVINASSNGNYIAFTDTTAGLVVGFDNLTDGLLNHIDTIEAGHLSAGNDSPMLYPSFNTYSHIEEGEDNAGLVWYQGSLSGGGIYYTRVRRIESPPNDTLFWTNYQNFELQTSASGPPEASDKAITITNGIQFETKPIIYRSLLDYDTTPLICIKNRKDNINWLDKSVFLGKYVIGSYTLYHRDYEHANTHWSHSGVNLAFSDDTVSSINSAQQDGMSIGGTYSNIAGDFNLNYTLGSDNIYQEPGLFGSLFLGADTLFGVEVDYVKSSPTKAAIGKNAHLAKAPQPNINNSHNMWKNRRVFETSDEDDYENPVIQTSANLFYKSAFDNKIVKHGFMGFESDSNNVYFDVPTFENSLEDFADEPYQVVASEPTHLDPCAGFHLSPYRSVFEKVSLEGIHPVDEDNDGDKEMELTMYGSKNDDIKLFLMRNSDSTMMELTTPSTTTYPANGTKLIYSILDSSGSTFTLIYEKLDTLARFTEKSFLGGLSTDDTVSYKSAIAKDPVKYILDFDSGANFEANNSDLLDFSVYPNPVSNVLTIQAILPEELNGNRLKNTLLELSISDITGRTVLNQMVSSGQIVTFDMSNQSNGVYNVKMRYTRSNQFESVRKIIKK